MFKVATKVTVQSRGYSFVLDREEDLGMISPIWVNRAVPTGRERWTGITLDFGPNKPYNDLAAQLLKIRDNILLFLPKLSIFKVNIDGTQFSVERIATGAHVTLKTTTDNSATFKDFLRVAKTIRMHVSDPKREGQTDTEVVLAFPLQTDGQPDLAMHPDVYAFLPLRRVGFKVSPNPSLIATICETSAHVKYQFVVQADFLTAANREDVLTDNNWNTAIRDSLPSAFVDAVDALRKTPSLELTWPRFIPRTNEISDPFFQLAADNVLSLLRPSAVIRCSDGFDRPPSQVRVVGSFKDAHGRPFVGPEHVGFHYIASEYPSDVVTILRSQLGVAEMTLYDFISGLINMNNRGLFKHWDTVWLEGVCDIIARVGFSWNNPQDGRIRSLRLVQLSTGDWVPCQSCDNYFFDSSGLSFPSGLTIQVISGSSSGSRNRCSLLRKLGVRDLDVSEVIKQIVALHRAGTPTFQMTLEQTLYLYNHRSLLEDDVAHIYLYDQHGKARAGNDMYMDDPHDSDSDSLRTLFGNSAPFVHDSFRQPVGLSNRFRHGAYAITQWQDWLITTFGVRTAPRFVGGQPPAEFLAVIDRHRLNDSPQLFRLLKKYWSRILAQNNDRERRSLQAYFGSLDVCCKSGQVVPLRATFFPSREIMQYNCNDLPLLDLSGSWDEWHFLGALGVSMQPDGKFFLKQLIALAQKPGNQANPSTVIGLYEHISARFLEFHSDVQ